MTPISLGNNDPIIKQDDKHHAYRNTHANLVHIKPFRQLSIDWLSLSCTVISDPKQFFQRKPANYSNNIWNSIITYYMDKKPFFKIMSKPKSSMLPSDSAIIKFENWILYSDHFFDNIHQIISDAGLKVRKINRLDIALDLHNFDHNIKPQTLIKNVMCEKWNKKGKSKVTSIARSNNELIFDYLRFGTKNSPVSIYMYNKTQEFREVAVKQHILETWKNAGYDENKEVWRIEISLKSEVKQLYDNESGELLQINLFTICNPFYLKSIYYSLFIKYFSFRIVDKSKHPSNWKPISILSDANNFALGVMDVEHRPDQTKIHKITLGQMVDFYNNANNLNDNELDKFYASIINYADRFSLRNYLFEKLSFTHPLDY